MNAQDLSPPQIDPHTCGDDSSFTRPLVSWYGSPPRMWGRPDGPERRETPLRFTPTHVGTTRRTHRRSSRWTVHPHACGDDSPWLWSSTSPSGSPPRMWGRRGNGVGQLFRHRFTPTHVGTTGIWCRSVVPPPVHPHACGDDRACTAGDRSSAGSPPRMWGRLDLMALRVHLQRFTPTHVGTTDSGNHCSRPQSVHPHACGDDCAPPTARLRRSGSPPRMWGRRRRPTGRGRRRSVHPHACGDDL